MLRALRRAGLAVRGALDCDPSAPTGFTAEPGRWAALVGARRLLEHGARALFEAAHGAGAALIVVADDEPARATTIEALLRAASAAVDRLDLRDVGAAERGVDLAAGRRAVLLAVAGCTRGAVRSPAVALAAARCNRCGACLSLGCPALSDPGEEAMRVDPAACTGCGTCLPLCRSGALVTRCVAPAPRGTATGPA